MFVLINAELGGEEELAEQLREIENVKEVYFVYGVYDIVVKIKADTMEKVKQTIMEKIRSLNNVRSTLSMVVVEES